ncbi:flagellar M-ring protein FliF C-terminal domain-containing protein [Catenovulum sediminis]|uniref:flagellar M-ring protein FliF C-terminal domain-containing protein n=1 Tax=Catenovulum sediminis TaxID=1740262 RepID=UPI00117C8BBF|nr:flagellar M-ring protein FliF C-terminal domain-containing protein [Catenovulum sediminis]
MENLVSDLRKKPMLTALIIGLAVMTCVAIWWLLVPTYQSLLPSGLSEANKNKAHALLMEWKVDYQVDPETGEILVQQQNLAELRHKLESVGVTEKHNVGWELFTDSDYGQSEFSQQINYQRGLEGEISNTLRSIHGIKSARVHLTLAKKTLFQKVTHPSKASVVLSLEQGVEVTSSWVASIQEFVAASVSELFAEQVIVLDSLGNKLIKTGKLKQVENISEHNQQLERKVSKLVSGMIGHHNISVVVSTVINLDKRIAKQEQFIPNSATGTVGYISKRKTEAKQDASATTENNTPPKIVRSDEEFLFSKEISEVEYAVGQIEKINVGIVIASPIAADVKDKIVAVVSSGLGLSVERGDSIEVVTGMSAVNTINENSAVSLPVPDNKNINKISAPAQTTNQEFNLVKWLPYGIIAAVLFIFFIVVFNKRSRKNPQVGTSLNEDEKQQLLLQVQEWLAEEAKTIEASGQKV